MATHIILVLLRKIVHNTVLLALIMYSPTVNLTISMNYEKKHLFKIEPGRMYKKLIFSLICSLMILFPTYEQWHGVKSRFFFVMLVTPWFYSSFITFLRNVMRFLGYTIMAMDMGFKQKILYRLLFIHIVIYLALFGMALEAMVHWIYIHHWQNTPLERKRPNLKMCLSHKRRVRR